MLLYYKKYLQQIDKKVTKVNKQLNLIYNQYNQYGGEFSEKPLIDMQNKVKNINSTLERLEKISPYVKRYKNRIVNLIQEIEKVHNSGGDHISGGLDSTKLDEMMKNLETMNNDIVALLNKETFRIHGDKEIHSNILIKSEKDSWENILIIYRLLVANFNEVFTQSKSDKLYAIYEQVLQNIDKNSIELDELEQVINKYEIQARSKIGTLLDTIDTKFDKSYIAYTKENIDEDDYKVKINFGVDTLVPYGADYTILKNILDQLIDHYYNTTLINISINPTHDAYKSITDVTNDERKTFQLGGDLSDHEKETHNIIKIKTSLTELSRKFEKINLKIGTSQELHDSYEQYRIRYSYYLMYLIMIMTKNQMRQEQQIFKYISKEIVQFYYNIIKDILSKIENMDKTTIITFFSVYHYFTLIKMKNFCKFLITNLSDDSIVDIFSCAPELLIYFTLFNNFKDLLESYDNNSV